MNILSSFIWNLQQGGNTLDEAAGRFKDNQRNIKYISQPDRHTSLFSEDKLRLENLKEIKLKED